jgi:hypothetical protein
VRGNFRATTASITARAAARQRCHSPGRGSIWKFWLTPAGSSRKSGAVQPAERSQFSTASAREPMHAMFGPAPAQLGDIAPGWDRRFAGQHSRRVRQTFAHRSEDQAVIAAKAFSAAHRSHENQRQKKSLGQRTAAGTEAGLAATIAATITKRGNQRSNGGVTHHCTSTVTNEGQKNKNDDHKLRRGGGRLMDRLPQFYTRRRRKSFRLVKGIATGQEYARPPDVAAESNSGSRSV